MNVSTQTSSIPINAHRCSLQSVQSQLLTTRVSLIIPGINQYLTCSKPILPWFSALAFLLPLPTTNGTLFTWTVSPSGLPVLTTPLMHQIASQPSLCCQSQLCSMQKWTNCFSPLFCVILVLTYSLKQYHFHSVLHEHSSFSFCQQPSLTYGLRARQRKCVMSRYPQFFISSPQISLTTNFHIAHTLKAQSLLFLPYSVH